MKLIGGNTTATLQKLTTTKNAIGEQVSDYVDVVELVGFLDLQSGTKTNQLSAFLQDSTHVFICDFVDLSEHKLTPENSRLVHDNKVYQIVTIDNPMNLNYQLEIYLTYKGWQNGE